MANTKTKTPKSRRQGIHRAAHHTEPVVHFQTHGEDIAYDPEFHGMTQMRYAFLSIPVTGRPTKLAKMILRRLHGYAGTYLTRGWRKLR